MSIIFALFRVITWILSRLPFPIIYAFSGLVRILLQYIIRYRRTVILNNLNRSFPEKSPVEIRKIISCYYQHLADIILEVIKLESISQDDLKDRFRFNGFEHLTHAMENGRNVILAFGHCGNWEMMAAALGLLSPVRCFGVVKPLSDNNFNKYIVSLRHRFNPGGTIPFQHTYRTLIRNKKEMISIYGIAADQTPTRADINYWSHFLQQDTPFYTGVEKLSKSLDFSVVFIDIYRVGRGRYIGDIQLITHDPKNTADLEITETYIGLLEKAIRQRPDNWLWSHKRWKFSRN
jgi:KDO2-lipid IV(A) lauroyltransferase